MSPLMFLLEKISILYLRETLLIDGSLFWRIISDAILSCSLSLSVMLRVEEEDLDRCLDFLLVLSLAELILASWFSCVSIMKKGDLGDSGDEGHVDSGAGVLQLN